jgi:hypothetical protein
MVHNKPIEIYKMKDKSDNFTIKKDPLFNLPCRLLILGKTGCGKSGKLGNFLLRSDMYRDDFLPENIFIFSGSVKGGGDLKLNEIIDQLDIPSSNVFDNYDEEALSVIYDMLVDNYNEALREKTKPEHSLVIFDDLGFSNLQRQNKKNDILNKLLANGRKFLISTITLNQRITQLSRACREQVSGAIIHSCSNQDLELVESQFNYLKDKKQFKEMFRKSTSESPHDFLVINFGRKNIYQNKNFQDICLCEKNKNDCGGVKLES